MNIGKANMVKILLEFSRYLIEGVWKMITAVTGLKASRRLVQVERKIAARAAKKVSQAATRTIAKRAEMAVEKSIPKTNITVEKLAIKKELPVAKKPLVAALEESTKEVIKQGLEAAEEFVEKIEDADPTGISTVVKWGLEIVKWLVDAK